MRMRTQIHPKNLGDNYGENTVINTKHIQFWSPTGLYFRHGDLYTEQQKKLPINIFQSYLKLEYEKYIFLWSCMNITMCSPCFCVIIKNFAFPQIFKITSKVCTLNLRVTRFVRTFGQKCRWSFVLLVSHMVNIVN